MQHEVLYALSGYPGELFVHTGRRLRLRDDVDFVTDVERHLADELLQVATMYMQLQAFCDDALGDPGACVRSVPKRRRRRRRLTSGRPAAAASAQARGCTSGRWRSGCAPSWSGTRARLLSSKASLLSVRI